MFAYWTSHGWVGPCDLQMGPISVGSRPSIMAEQSTNGSVTIGWEGADGNLWEAYSASPPSCSGWTGPRSLGDGPLGSVPSLLTQAPGGGQYIDSGWVGNGGGKNLWWREGGNGIYNLGMGPLNSPPTVTQYPYPENEYYDAFWAGIDGNLWWGAWSWDPIQGISLLPLFPLAIGGRPLGSAPGAVYAQGVDQWYVVWEGTHGGLWEATNNDTVWILRQVDPSGTI